MKNKKGEMRKKITLSIDTSSNKLICVGISINGKEDKLERQIDKQKTQVILPMTAELLKKNKVSFQDITNISVVTGPGSFTGLRVGIAIANALSFSLGVPINNQKLGTIVSPIY